MHCGRVSVASLGADTTNEKKLNATRTITQIHNIYYDCIINCLQYGAGRYDAASRRCEPTAFQPASRPHHNNAPFILEC